MRLHKFDDAALFYVFHFTNRARLHQLYSTSRPENENKLFFVNICIIYSSMQNSLSSFLKRHAGQTMLYRHYTYNTYMAASIYIYRQTLLYQ